jgi:hypothetical protein
MPLGCSLHLTVTIANDVAPLKAQGALFVGTMAPVVVYMLYGVKEFDSSTWVNVSYNTTEGAVLYVSAPWILPQQPRT